MIRGIVPSGYKNESVVTEWNKFGEDGIRPSWNVNPGTISVPHTGTVDYTGVKVGSIVVIGYFGFDTVSKTLNGKTRCHQARHRWLIQCTCGRYEIRSQRAIRKSIKNTRRQDLKIPCCQQCEECILADVYTKIEKGAKDE